MEGEHTEPTIREEKSVSDVLELGSTPEEERVC